MPRKLPPGFMPVAFSFYMSGIMALVMSAVLTAVNTGLGPGLLGRVLHAYLLAWPVAFVSVLAVRPAVMRLVALTVDLRPPR